MKQIVIDEMPQLLSVTSVPRAKVRGHAAAKVETSWGNTAFGGREPDVDCPSEPLAVVSATPTVSDVDLFVLMPR